MSLPTVRPRDTCRYDAVALGEVMLRLDPGEGRIRTARSFQAWEGGGEYNVARSLSRVFGLRTSVVTALVDNEVGHLIEELILAGGLDTSLIRWAPYDGIGRAVRNGLNFTERGFGVRAPLGVSDRGHTAVSQLTPEDVDFDHLFGDLGVRWLHTGGIFSALSRSAGETALEAVRAAQRHGTVVSFDANYRPSLWAAIGDSAAAHQELNREILRHVDVLVTHVDAFTRTFGIEVAGGDFDGMVTTARQHGPALAVVAAPLRTFRSATRHDWGAVGWSAETGLVHATERQDLEILDRVGGGDSFASGLIYGLMTGEPLPTALEYAAAHGALAMTTPGDSSTATREEVVALAAGTPVQSRR